MQSSITKEDLLKATNTEKCRLMKQIIKGNAKFKD
jgi:hypothetical protein